MQRVLLVVLLGMAQQAFGQFKDLELGDILMDLDVGSGDYARVFSSSSVTTYTSSSSSSSSSSFSSSSRCSGLGFGYRCRYPQLDYNPTIPEDQISDNFGEHRMCNLFGAGDILTFDRAITNHRGSCEVLVAKICDVEESPSIWIKRSPKCDDCITEMRIKMSDRELILNEKFTEGGVEKSLPGTFGEAEAYRKSDFVVVDLDKIKVRFSFKQSKVDLFFPDSLSSRTCGLCGNMDGAKADDVDDRGSPSFIDHFDKKCLDHVVPSIEHPDFDACMKRDTVHRMCNLLVSESFSTCLSVINPAPFFELCLRDVCMGDVEADGDLLCNITTEYARQCQLNEVHVGQWRVLANCAVPCPLGFEWSECTDTTRTCAAFGSEDIYEVMMCNCEAGCECMRGTYLQDGACVPAEKCMCEMEGKMYEPNAVVQTECTNNCTCQEGHWLCTDEECSGVAVASGIFHYTTFDGRTYQYKDSCTHILAKDRDENDFTVLVSYEEEAGIFYKSAVVLVKEGSENRKYELKRNGDIKRDGKLVSAPFKTGLVEIQLFEGSVVLTIVGKGVQVMYDGVAGIVVKVPPHYKGRMGGLGGNYNGKQLDDFRLGSNFVSMDSKSFVDDWKYDKTCEGEIPDIGTPKECSAAANSICFNINKQSHCLDYMKAATTCQADVCSLTTPQTQSTVACSFARTFASACFARDKSSFTSLLDIGAECEQECPDDREFREGSECLASCASFASYCTTDYYTGCFCPEGTYSDNEGRCVAKEDCPCLVEGTWYESGAVTSIPNKKCSCQAGIMECKEMNETIACPSPDMQYYSCEDPADIQGAACESTCKYIDDLCMAGACMTGCACKPGLYRTAEGNCVAREECGCYTGTKYYKHGEFYMDDCNKVTCLGGKFVSTDLVCPRTCWAAGASHYKTFDGLRYDFEGDCEYILATDYCPNNPNGGLFSVHTKNSRCGSRGMTCSKSIIITVKNQRIVLERGHKPVIKKMADTRFRRAITGFTDHSAVETFTIKQKGVFTVIDTCIGMTVLWDNGTRVYIRLTEEFKGTTCGFCGNFDNSDENDLILSTGLKSADVLKFGNSWRFPAKTSACPEATVSTQVNASCTNLLRREWADDKCRVITDVNGVFAKCHSTVDPLDYYDMCVHDACGCDGGGDCECLCTAIAHYAHVCSNEGVPIEWRSNSLCPIMCEQYNDNEDVCLWHYRPCATCITDTCCECQQPEDTHWCVEGCFPKCPTGYILDEMTQRCVRASERDAKCTRFSSENMCHTCAKCEVCKTLSGAELRIQPGQTVYFPVASDACEKEWCAIDTTGDLCYNGTVNWYDCKEEGRAIPPYDERYYVQTCWNATESLCSNCRDCKNECKLRADSCDVGRTPESKPWRKVFPILPMPERGAKTYCVEYSCENHPDAREPQCYRQREARVRCAQNIDEVICAEHEVLKIYPTGDDCCPEEYECVCEICKFNDSGKVEYVKSIQPGEIQEWCKDEDESNCCYTDSCTVDELRTTKTVCPVMTRTQAPCTTGPAPTCSPGFIWKNLTRPDDCCSWGECECDACYDYDSMNNRVLKLVGDVWNKKCLKFSCTRGARDSTGCYQTRNIQNITCAAKPVCKSDEYAKIVGIDEWECCDIYDCVCYDQCHITKGGTERVMEVGQEFSLDDGCWYRCVDPRTSEDDKNCPRPEKICYPPENCEKCEFIAATVNDTCGCPKYDCQTVERCPSIDCPFPYVRTIDPTADECKAPCYDCACKECWDQHQNRTYKVGAKWVRQFLEPSSCENCECTNALDEDGCLKESCTPKPCPERDVCESPHDTEILGENECGCTILLGCVCPHCMYNGKIVEGKSSGDSWTVGNVALGCYDTYSCLPFKTRGVEKECFNVTKERNLCLVDDECPEDFIPVKNEARSCDYDDKEHCPSYDCVCVKCRFNGKSYNPGETWNENCIDYTCTDVTDEGDPAKCKKIESSTVGCPAALLNCEGCYVEYLKQKREVPDHCCDEWDCKPELFCVNEFGERVPNGTIWRPAPCKRVQCIVSEKDWANGVCPAIVVVDHCDPDPTECTKCQNRTIVSDECGCDKVECPLNDEPKSCNNPAENQIIGYFSTGDGCYSSKNCCVCDDACYYKGERKELMSVWWDKSTCQRLRCVLPEQTLKLLDFDPDKVYFDEVEDFTTWSQMVTKLNFRKMLSDTKIPTSLYSECSQDVSLCPITYDLGCPKPEECGPCETTEETVDGCGCPVLKCTPYVCPPAPYNVETCVEPKVVKKTISLQGLSELYPCCKNGTICECRKGCEDKDGNLHPVGEVWTEEGPNECGRTKTKKRCADPSEFPDTTPECPKEVLVPCEEPITCGNCENRTSYIDDYCCEIASCGPLNEPVQCVEPGANQRISSLETNDECFPSKDCCVCENTCTYKAGKHQLFEVWQDDVTCQRMRCVLPETTLVALGYETPIDYSDLDNKALEASLNEVKTSLDFRRMVVNANTASKLYDQCQQDITMCPKSVDIGCAPVDKCPECHTTNITQDKCGCDVSTCTIIERCPSYISCPFPYRSTEKTGVDPCTAPCYECVCDHVCFDNFDNSTHEPEDSWKRTYRTPEKKCETCTCTADKDEKDGCLKEKCEPIPCPAVEECEAPYNKAVYGTDDCGCKILLECECTQCMHNGEIVANRSRGDSWTDGDVERGCYDTYYCDPLKIVGKPLECYNVTKKRAECVVDPDCPEDFVPVKDEDKSCCFDGTCCPRYNCECVKCRFDGKSYNPGEEWSKDCIDYTCTNISDSTGICLKKNEQPTPCNDTKPVCKQCYVETLDTKRDVAAGDCCNIWGCTPEKVCIKEDGARVPNGTIWRPDQCTRVMCYVSDEDWANGVCPTPTPINPCTNDLSVSCPLCSNKTIVKDECNCDSVSCPPNNEPKSCKDPSENQIIDYFNTGDSCFSSKNCCVCDDACYYKGARKELLSVWQDKSTCQRLRCVLPAATLTSLGFDPKSVIFEDLDDFTTWTQLAGKLNYRKMLSDTNIPKSLYSECSQDVSLCPIAYDIGCPKPKECAPCETTEETVDECGCPVLKCTPYVCPPAPFDVENCPEPEVVKKNISLEGRSSYFPCCKYGFECECRKGCEDKDGKLHEVGDVWDEEGPNECGRTLTKKRCLDPSEFPDPKPKCPKEQVVPCEEPITCGNCENRTSYIDEYCCEIASCAPLNAPKECIDPLESQRVSNLETGDECFPSKDCCVCDSTCTYKGRKHQLFNVWQDEEACTRMRCVLPETTLAALGVSSAIDYENLEDKALEASLTELKASLDYRKMMTDSKVASKLYEQCQQDISLCPKAIDIGCSPVDKCPECHTTTIVQDKCGCNVSTCDIIPRCPSFISCPFPYRSQEKADVDPCTAPCYECVCDHACLDNFDNSTHAPEETWRRTYTVPEKKCETCTCTNDKDEKDGCLRETCEPIPCPAVAECEAPYNKAIYGKDDCGCKILLECECTQCMYNGEVVAERSRGDMWTIGDVALGCYDTYSCSPVKTPGNQLECYNVTKSRADCPVDPECPEDFVPVKDEDRSCCFDGTCCPRYNCECVKCRFDGKSYNPGDEWSKDCIDYTCTNISESTDVCLKKTEQPSPCDDTKPVCEKCYVEALLTKRDVAAGECCNIWGCTPEKVCIQEDGTRVPNGTIWRPDKCTRLMCYVSDKDWTDGVCPVPTPINPCTNDLSISCPACTNKTIVKDECNCDSVTCPPNREPVQCTTPTANQVLTTLETGDSCYPSKNCCMCENTCLYKGKRMELFSVWTDKSTCSRMRCLPSNALLKKLGYDSSVIDFKDIDNVALWNEIRTKINFRDLLSGSKIATNLYGECSQDSSLCPVAKDIGCAEPKVCANCTHTKKTLDACGCVVHTCEPYVCPPAPYDVTECTPPKTKLVEISLKDLSDLYPCCPVGKKCICEETCFDKGNKSREILEEWEEASDYVCSSDPTASGTIVKKRCNAGNKAAVPTDLLKSVSSAEGALSILSETEAAESSTCPYTTIVPCDEPTKCAPCETETRTLDERCCPVVTCKRIECDINVAADCLAPKIAFKSDSGVTGDECCPKYCDCPFACTETETGKVYDRNLVWPHPRNACYTRTCLVDATGFRNGGCPYIANNTICKTPDECGECYTASDSVDTCGCTQRKCERNSCPEITCDECDEPYDTGDVDSCSCPIKACRPKPCQAKLLNCEDPEKSVYSWMDLSLDPCCKQQGCRCNFTKCVEPKCPSGQIPVRNVTATKCCCPEYMCVPNDDSQCTDYNGIPRKVGQPWINKDNHCKMLQCTFSSAKKSAYKIEEFDRYTCFTERPMCVNGGIPYLASTKEGCCREWVCPCTCQVYGDPHFTTFDGFSYDYQGKCTYTLMKEYAFNDTEVIVDNELCKWQSARRKSLSCLKTATVVHRGVNYTFTFGMKFLRNGEEISARKPWASPDNDVNIREFGYRQLKLSINSLEMDLVYKAREWSQSLILTMPYEALEGRMMGLCGSCNNDVSDDFRDRKFKPVDIKNERDQTAIDKFGEGWMKYMRDFDNPLCFPEEPVCPEEADFPDCGELPPDECINCDNKCHLSHPKCSSCETDPCQVLRTHSVYKEARSHIDPRVYMAKCAFDLSLEVNSSRKCDACFSASIAQYGALNEKHGQCIPWRTALGCTGLTCPHPTQEYRECDLDAKRDLSCENVVLNITASVNVEGCFCPEGTIRRTATSEECVPLKCCHGCGEPPTCEDGSTALVGERTDGCGCPVYMCSDVKGCEVQQTEQLLEINIAGRICRSPESVVSASCRGNCAVSTTSVNGEVEASCSRCNPTSSTTRSLSLVCEDGSSENYEYDVIEACECASCSSCTRGVEASGDEMIVS